MKKRLLLADDSITIQKVIQITFSHDDYVMTVVDNGDAAYEKALAEKPDLVLADVFMPGKNGYELCAAIKQNPALAATPVLLLTGTFEPFDEAKARSVGANKWIAKPFESQSLISCVEELLANRATAPVVPPVAAAAIPAPAAVAPPVPPQAPVAPLVAPLSAPEPLPPVDDIWGSEFAVEPSGGASIDLQPIPQEAAGDLWDVGSFDTSAQTFEPAASNDDLWGSFDTSADILSPAPMPLEAAPQPVEEDVWGSSTDFSSAFEPSTIASGSAIDTMALQDDFALASDVEVLEEVDLGESVFVEPQQQVFLQEAPVLAMPSAPEPAWEDVGASTNTFGSASAPAPVVVPSIPTAPALSATLPSLNDADLEKVVEKVAGAVIERLAGTILEKIAWEVVPELAETLIKEEIRKIREQVAA